MTLLTAPLTYVAMRRRAADAQHTRIVLNKCVYMLAVLLFLFICVLLHCALCFYCCCRAALGSVSAVSAFRHGLNQLVGVAAASARSTSVRRSHIDSVRIPF